MKNGGTQGRVLHVRLSHLWQHLESKCGQCTNWESENPNNLYAIAIKNVASVIGHIPRKLSAACSLFLSLGETMNCDIMDNHRQYSADLLQGGLKIPCKFVFCANHSLLCKLKKLVQSMSPI